MTRSHVTMIYDAADKQSLPQRKDGGPPYIALCAYCPWRREGFPTRRAAVDAARFHRTNAAVQEL
jgi:hypothetical protein